MDGKESTVKGIYRWIFLDSTKTYIGKANNFRDRYWKYKYTVNKSKNTKSPINNALQKYGIENCKYEIVEICNPNIPTKELLLKETNWIKYYRSLTSQNGYNVCSESTDCTGYKRSEERKLKQIGNQYAKGHLRSKETKAKMCIAAKKRGCKHLNKIINQLDLAGNFIKKWNSIRDALQSLSKPYHSSNIGSVLRNKTKSAYGFRWEYADKNGVVTHEV